VATNGHYDIIVLDEVSHAIRVGLIQVELVLQLMEDRPSHIELILTGRNMPAALVEAADLVTDMVAVRHPYDRGIPMRKGIEF